MTPLSEKRTSGLLIVGAFAVVYLAWGCAYLAVRVAVVSIPPFLVGATRNVAAGLVLVAMGLAGGAARPSTRAMRQAFVVGLLLFVVNHGGLAWASQRNPSGITALLAATIPIWMATLDWGFGSGSRPSARTGVGVVLGFAGTLLLLGPAAGGPSIDPLAAAVTTGAAISWAAGTLRTRRMRVSDSPTVSTGLPMLLAGLTLAAVSWAAGELTGFRPADVPPRAVFALLYLIVMGSLLGFSAYVFLLRTMPAARVVTYAYVNPVVALLVGTWLGGEVVGGATVIAAAVSLAGVYLVVSD